MTWEKIFNPISSILNINYETTTVHERAQMRHDYINKLKSDDCKNLIVAWDYLEYIPGLYHVDFNYTKEPWYDKRYLISTTGMLAYLVNGKIKIYCGCKDKNGYKKSLRKKKKGFKSFFIHRAVVSTFLPVPGGSKSKIETVNHKNGNKEFNFLINLEWMSNEENLVHAIENDLNFNKPIRVKGTLVLDDDNYGKSFILNSQKEIAKLGLEPAAIGRAKNNGKSAYGCKWEDYRGKDIDGIFIGIPSFYSEMVKDRAYINTSITPILGEFLTGPYQGQKFVIFGKKEFNDVQIDHSTVSKTCKGVLSSFLKISWRWISRVESKQYPRGLSKEQQKYVLSIKRKE